MPIRQNKEIIRLLNNELKLIYNKNSFSINGSGNIFFQENNDFIKYQLKKNNKTFEFKTSLIINDNPFKIDFLNYQKDPNTEMSINLEGINIKNDKTIINQFNLNENKNKIEIKDLILNKNFKVTDLSNINLNYHDKKKEYNSIQLYKKGAEFFLKGLFFNANNLIDNLLDDNESDSNFLEIDKKINIDLNKIRLDENYILEKFSGYLSFKDKKIENANLNGNFLNNKKLKFTVNNNSNDKITTLYLGEAGPIVNRYKFVKGFSGIGTSGISKFISAIICSSNKSSGFGSAISEKSTSTTPDKLSGLSSGIRPCSFNKAINPKLPPLALFK